MQRADSLEKILMMGKIKGKRRECQRVKWLDNITVSIDMNLSKFQDIVKERKAFSPAVPGVTENGT